ncbi:MAG: hypothetical protein H3C26_01185 [Rhodocyclaceae bacterium]|nr:hypothetical protein [Rhodocyclaceae bacterium]
MTASDDSKLVMNTGTANGGDAGVAGGTVRVGLSEDGFTGRVDFPERAGTGFLSINGNDYTVIDSLGAQDSATGTDLQGMENDLAGHYALGSDIDASDTAGWEDGKGFAPVGSAGFTGTFDGLGHTIGKLTIDRPDQMFVGLFRGLGGDAALRNVGLAGGSVTGKEWVGGLLGSDSWGKLIRIGNVFSTAKVTGENYVGGLAGSIGTQETGALALNNAWAGGEVFGAGNAVGGLAGSISAYGGSITVDNAWAVGNVTGNDRVGGLVGVAELSGDDVHDESHVSISKVSASGKVTGTDQVGGLIGRSEGMGADVSISDARATGSVTGNGDVGGLVGYSVVRNDGTSSLSRARATGDVTGNYNVGGLVGQNESFGGNATASIDKAHATGAVTGTSGAVGGLVGKSHAWTGDATVSITNAYATGSVTTGSLFVGGLVGCANRTAISNAYATGAVRGVNFAGGLVGYAVEDVDVSASFWDTQSTGQTSSSGGGTGMTTAEMKTLANFSSATEANGNVDPAWDISANGGEPRVWRIYEGDTAPLLRD